MKRLLPGPFTFSLPSISNTPKIIMTHQKIIGVRISDNIFISEIVKQLGNLIISTTIRLDKQIIKSNPFGIVKQYSHIISMLFHDDTCFQNPSVIINLTGDVIEIFRKGSGNIHEF